MSLYVLKPFYYLHLPKDDLMSYTAIIIGLTKSKNLQSSKKYFLILFCD